MIKILYKYTDEEEKMRSKKSNIAAFVFCFLLGFLGFHRFYVGKTVSGIFQLLTLGFCGIWTLIDLIIITSGNFRDIEGNKLIWDWEKDSETSSKDFSIK